VPLCVTLSVCSTRPTSGAAVLLRPKNSQIGLL
jgi:hypothetical protein